MRYGPEIGTVGSKCMRQIGVCTVCVKSVHLITHPAHNEIDIGGEAVALNCISSSRKDERKRMLQNVLKNAEQ